MAQASEREATLKMLAFYSFLKIFYKFLRDRIFKNNFNVREVDDDKMLLITFGSFHMKEVLDIHHVS